MTDKLNKEDIKNLYILFVEIFIFDAPKNHPDIAPRSQNDISCPS